ncbi:hypothetical protein IWX78_002031 [Mycetocola sp. CAN_C7]|uniref:hypothetical protein n=1 Tax=Mycetocola sp. CAN_C7 TaxID=2787724 RepID=UPI0018C9D7B0
MPVKPAVLFTAATTSYLANCVLGTAVATGTLTTGRAHWVHHALYISTATLAGAATSSLFWSRNRAGWLLLPAAVPLILIPAISSHSRRHIGTALSAAPFFVASLIKAWR